MQLIEESKKLKWLKRNICIYFKQIVDMNCWLKTELSKIA